MEPKIVKKFTSILKKELNYLMSTLKSGNSVLAMFDNPDFFLI